MTGERAALILAHLGTVAAEREARRANASLERRVQQLKAFQQTRFARTHADLLVNPRYGPAARFFLQDLYGPHDFTGRDEQFARIVPAISRLFPDQLLRTVEALGELHALSEQLDTRVARHLPVGTWGRAAYLQAWQAAAGLDERLHQLELVLTLGRHLERHTRSGMLRHSLRMMRSPARAAGLADLQAFLERGFDAFAAMRGAESFLATVHEREHAAIQRYFSGDAVTAATAAARSDNDPIGQLP